MRFIFLLQHLFYFIAHENVCIALPGGRVDSEIMWATGLFRSHPAAGCQRWHASSNLCSPSGGEMH